MRGNNAAIRMRRVRRCSRETREERAANIKKRVKLSSLLAMKLELKICFQNHVSGNSDSEAARSNQKEKRQMYCGFARLFSTSSRRKKVNVSVMDTLITTSDCLWPKMTSRSGA